MNRTRSLLKSSTFISTLSISASFTARSDCWFINSLIRSSCAFFCERIASVVVNLSISACFSAISAMLEPFVTTLPIDSIFCFKSSISEISVLIRSSLSISVFTSGAFSENTPTSPIARSWLSISEISLFKVWMRDSACSIFSLTEIPSLIFFSRASAFLLLKFSFRFSSISSILSGSKRRPHVGHAKSFSSISSFQLLISLYCSNRFSFLRLSSSNSFCISSMVRVNTIFFAFKL